MSLVQSKIEGGQTELTERDLDKVTGGAVRGESVDLTTGTWVKLVARRKRVNPLSPEALGWAAKSDSALWRGYPAHHKPE